MASLVPEGARNQHELRKKSPACRGSWRLCNEHCDLPIVAELSLSEKTSDRQVSNIFTKLSGEGHEGALVVETLPSSILRSDPKRLRYCAGVRLTLRRNSRLKKPASS